jgi:hypothetical protein
MAVCVLSPGRSRLALLLLLLLLLLAKNRK